MELVRDRWTWWSNAGIAVVLSATAATDGRSAVTPHRQGGDAAPGALSGLL
ncbi:MAG: hypothetical protein M3O70_13840 [Actinomycetota bacterium]|nr:hypothetical protein [Actinomycetota bacterium]